jgi:hypothetical protein
MRWFLVPVAICVPIACTYVQDFSVPNGPAEGDAGTTEASCASVSDPESCGVCGHSCLRGACAAGVCQPVVLASGQGDSAFPGYTSDIGDPHTGPDRIAVDGAFVYWLNLRGEVMRVSVAGGNPERLATTSGMPQWLVIDDTSIYFSTLPGGVYRMPKAGGSPALVTTPAARPPIYPVDYLQPYPVELSLAGGDIYFADASGVHACPVTGCTGAPRVIDPATTDAFPYSFALDAAGKKYAAEEGHRDIDDAGSYTESYAMTWYDDAAGQFLGSGSGTAYYELHGADNGVYALAATRHGVIGVVHWTQGAQTFLASGDAVPPDPTGLAVDEDYVYWCNGPANTIDVQQRRASVVRCKKTGCAIPEVLADGQIVPRATAVTKDAVFWTTGDGRVMKLAKPASPTSPAR